MTFNATASNEPKDESNEKTIPDGYRVAGIRVRGREGISKDSYKAIVSALIEGIKTESEEIEDAIQRADIVEEMVKEKIYKESIEFRKS